MSQQPFVWAPPARAVACAFLAAIVVLGHWSRAGAAATPSPSVRNIVGNAIAPVMKKYGIPGMAVGVTVDGRHYVLNYGLASEKTGRRVNDATLFEIGSVTKTFTATMAEYAAVGGKLGLSDRVSEDFPPLRSAHFGSVRLLDLGTHTSGGLPLQFPDRVQSDGDAVRFYRQWKPVYPPGTVRLYSNTGIMLLGVITAKRLGGEFADLLQHVIIDPLGLHNTFLRIPADKAGNYAQGYEGDGTPRRMFPGPLADEAYGVRSTAGDLLTFIDANMGLLPLNGHLQRAIAATHEGYFQVGGMTQDLIWEQYRYPTRLATLLRGNSPEVLFDPTPVRVIVPPKTPIANAYINKTGSTGGFAAWQRRDYPDPHRHD